MRLQDLTTALGGAVAVVSALSAPVAAESLRPPEAPELLVITPVTLEAHPQGELMPNATGCAVDIDDGHAPAQRVITVGAGETETLSCVGFVAAGPIPLPHALGLIYDFESGPGMTFRGALILSHDTETGAWSVNEDYPDLAVNADIADLTGLRAALEAR
ncbi:MAG: hypothetical protein Q4G26_14550 [Paracoccus sp. (in: a-proteobacteria)]|nr:hypothetical protein [Paracoccus sp. (in: a-proteobacteria)]